MPIELTRPIYKAKLRVEAGSKGWGCTGITRFEKRKGVRPITKEWGNFNE